MLSLRSAIPMTTSSLSTCSGSVPVGLSRMAWFALCIAIESGVCASISSSHLMRSTFEAMEEAIPPHAHSSLSALLSLSTHLTRGMCVDLPNHLWA